MNIKKILVLLLFAIAIIGITAPVEAKLNLEASNMDNDINYENLIVNKYNENINFELSKSISSNIKTDKNELTSGCCSVVLQGKNDSFAYAYRRDSTYAADLYIKKVKLHGKQAIKEYKMVNGYFFHTVVLKDGWFIGTGGADIPSVNKALEDLGGKIASKGKITNKDMSTAQNTVRKLGIGHFIIKSPEGNVGLTIYNGGSTKTTLLKMKVGEYVSVPNSPSYYRKGKYTVNKSNLVDAAIYAASTDRWGVNRRNIIAYDVKKIDKTTNVKIWASNDNGKNVGRVTNRADNINYKGNKTKATSIPKIPKKIYIGEATLK